MISENLENSNAVYLQDCLPLRSKYQTVMLANQAEYVIRYLVIGLALTRTKGQPYSFTVVSPDNTNSNVVTVLDSKLRNGLAFEPIGKFILYEKNYLLKAE